MVHSQSSPKRNGTNRIFSRSLSSVVCQLLYQNPAIHKNTDHKQTYQKTNRKRHSYCCKENDRPELDFPEHKYQCE